MSKRKNSEERADMLAERRVRQRTRQSDYFWPWSKSNFPQYRKSIWPEGKTANASRMG